MKRSVEATVLAGLFLAFLTGAFAWDVSISGTGTFSADFARAVALDASGNVVAAGKIANHGSLDDFTVVKFDANGHELWRQSIRGTDDSSGEATAVVVDASGDVIAAGSTTNSDTGRDLTVAKFNGATGAALWRQVIDAGTGSRTDAARTIAVDFRGDLIVGGIVGGRVVAGGGSISTFFVVKLSGADGQELWHQIIESSGAGAANSVAFDAAGDVVVAGGVDDFRGRDGKFIVIKFDGGSGAELWRQVVVGSLPGSLGSSEARSIAIDAEGNILAGGRTRNSETVGDFTVIKFDGANGRELWRQVTNGTGVNAVVVDAAGNFFAAGSFTVAKFNGTTGEVLWMAPFSGSGSFSEANAVTLDGDGNLTVAGTIVNTGSGRDLAVLKFEGTTGDVLWRRVVDGTSSGVDEAFALAVGSAGNPVVVGATANAGSDRDFFVASLEASSGADLWRQEINGLGRPTGGFGVAAALDSRGDVLAAGNVGTIGSAFDMIVTKRNGRNGTELWRAAINGTANQDDYVSSLAVDGGGNVVVAGRSGSTSVEFIVAKLDAESGRQLWQQALQGSDFAEAHAVTVDHNDDVVAAGIIRNTTTSDDFAVVKLDRTTGVQLWRQVIDGGRNNFDSALAVAVDAAGDVVATGRTETASFNRNFTVAKLDRATGSVLWLKAVPGTDTSFNDQASAVAVDGAGDIVAAGKIRNTGTFGDFTVIKFNGRSGDHLWQQSLRGTGNFESEATAVAVDPAGNVVAAGSIHNTDSGDDFAVVKFDGSTGAELWRQVITGSGNQDDQALSVGLDREGHVIAAGVLRNTGTGGDFAVLKLDGATGTELWRRVIDGTEHGDDEARAVMVGPAGNVVAVGSLLNTGTGSEFTVIKLRGTDGADFIGKPKLTVTPRVVRAGGTITATWSGINEPAAKDWIGIYSVGAKNREFIDWVYVSCSKTPSNPQAEGACPIVVPSNLTPGEYELRLFANDTYTRLAKSGVFRVRRVAR